jgi:hypothetical protein
MWADNHGEPAVDFSVWVQVQHDGRLSPLEFQIHVFLCALTTLIWGHPAKTTDRGTYHARGQMGFPYDIVLMNFFEAFLTRCRRYLNARMPSLAACKGPQPLVHGSVSSCNAYALGERPCARESRPYRPSCGGLARLWSAFPYAPPE